MISRGHREIVCSLARPLARSTNHLHNFRDNFLLPLCMFVTRATLAFYTTCASGTKKKIMETKVDELYDLSRKFPIVSGKFLYFTVSLT